MRLAGGFSLDLMDQLAFYGSYHSRRGNQLVHFFFVPLIMWSVGVWLAYAGALVPGHDLPPHLGFLPPALAEACSANWALVFVLGYGAYYCCLEPVAGASWVLALGLPMWVGATAFRQHISAAWAWAAGAHVLGWVMQVQVGHAWIERRRPALLDSFFQSLVLAGLFAWMEGLFALGYRPRLQAALDARVKANLAEHAAQQQARQALLAGEAAAAAK